MKQKILIVNPIIFLDTCKHGIKGEIKVIHPIPEDSRLVRVFQGGTFGELYMVITSESFPELKDGDEIPIIEKPLFEKIYSK